MTSRIYQEVKDALNSFSAARESYFNVVGIAVTKEAKSPSTEENIRDLELQLGKTLPPSYRAFLLIQDGFSEFDTDVNLLSVHEMLDTLKADTGNEIREQLRNVEEDLPKEYVVFGRSDNSTSMYLFNPNVLDEHGEWQVIEIDEEEGVDNIHESFLKFLRLSTEEAKDAEKEAAEGEDLLDLDF